MGMRFSLHLSHQCGLLNSYFTILVSAPCTFTHTGSTGVCRLRPEVKHKPAPLPDHHVLYEQLRVREGVCQTMPVLQMT